MRSWKACSLNKAQQMTNGVPRRSSGAERVEEGGQCVLRGGELRGAAYDH